MRIAIIDSDIDIREILRNALLSEGHAIIEAADHATVTALLQTQPFDLVILDGALPGCDGLALLQEIRTAQNTPVILISSQGDVIDRIIGLELGADDYITKPFHLREVLARIHAVLRRYKASVGAASPEGGGRTSRFEFDGWLLDTGRRELRTPDSQVCMVTTAEYQLLECLVTHPGRVLSRDELTQVVKGHRWSPEDRLIDGLVARLRKKLEGNREHPQFLKTVRGMGYVLAAQVKQY